MKEAPLQHPHVELSVGNAEVIALWRHAVQWLQRERRAREKLEVYDGAAARLKNGAALGEEERADLEVIVAQDRGALQDALDHAGLMSSGALLDLDGSLLERACASAVARIRAEQRAEPPTTGMAPTP